MASWIIDENLTFEIDIETLKFDFEYLNIQDTKSFEKYEDELSYYNLIQDEVNPIFEGDGGDIFEAKRKYEYSITKPEMKFNKRFYGSVIIEDYDTKEVKLNIERLEKSFFSNRYGVSSPPLCGEFINLFLSDTPLLCGGVVHS